MTRRAIRRLAGEVNRSPEIRTILIVGTAALIAALLVAAISLASMPESGYEIPDSGPPRPIAECSP